MDWCNPVGLEQLLGLLHNARPEGFEPPTPWSEATYSIR